MTYKNKHITSIQINEESHPNSTLNISTSVDTLNMCTISFNNSHSIRLNTQDLNTLISALTASNNFITLQQSWNNNIDPLHLNSTTEKEMANEADNYNPEHEYTNPN